MRKYNAPVQRRAAQRSVRCNRLLGGTVSSGSLHFGLTRTMSARMATRLAPMRVDEAWSTWVILIEHALHEALDAYSLENVGPRQAQCGMVRAIEAGAQNLLLADDSPTHRELFSLLQHLQRVGPQKQRAWAGHACRRIQRHDLPRRRRELGTAPRRAQPKLGHHLLGRQTNRVAVVHRTVEAAGLLEILDCDLPKPHRAALPRLRPTVIAIVRTLEVARCGSPPMLTEKHPGDLRRVRHPAPHELDRLGPLEESVRVRRSNQVGVRDVPEFAPRHVGWALIRWRFLLPVEVAMPVQPARPICRVHTNEQVLDLR